jgi:hypothetical protein
MPNSLLDGVAVRHHLLPETVRAQAKADLRKPKSTTFVDYRARVACEVVCPVLAGLDLKEITALIEQATGRVVNERQIARWKTGEERPQFDALIAVERFRQPLVIAWAKFIEGAGVEVETVVRLRLKVCA